MCVFSLSIKWSVDRSKKEIWRFWCFIQVSPTVRKFALLCFIYKRLTLVPVFANKEIWEDFSFYDKRWKAKIGFSVSFAAAVTKAVCTSGSKNGPTKLLPQELHSALQQEATGALKCRCASVLYLRLFCASVSKMPPKAMLLCAIPSYKSFQRNFPIVR